ncbi:recombinase family protein [Shinella zoogloeoides]|uniref:Recombinase family protein n=1 Tax=Shinella zoogloeoides TaxID=352475 RepID=A0A6N8TD60_SHIZO|nr:recombinase family protein [Shinella zoogloeoides]MXO01193.1 recombinase family protein [Shinella zoogloeoides]UEX81806.1 recombinase family protein [Shinella zoogloeoides]
MNRPISHDTEILSAMPALRAVAYLRVSTGRQAESDLSIPDQRKQITQYCLSRGFRLVAEYVEPGASATDDARPEFQQLIERATDGDHPFDVVIVHSYSRFFRDSFGLEMYIRRLAKADVRLISITQELGDDPAQVMMRQVIALFDEYQSRENAKHVLRAMKENARQGFYNGSPVPLGYRTTEAERRGAKSKKHLAIDPVEAETVRLIFRLYLEGDGRSGPLGIKEIVKRLNGQGYRTRRGASFGVGTLHAILTNRVYIGEWTFNRRDSRTLKNKPAIEHVVMPVPAIIDRDQFEAVEQTLKLRNPKVTPPRVTTGPILLTGLSTCATCGGGMTLRTGTSKNGTVHRYYTCSAAARSGKSVCKGRSIRMDTLDDLVIKGLTERLLTPDRLREILASITSARAAKAAEVDGRVTRLTQELHEAETRLKRLYTMVEDGIAEMDDILRDRITSLKLDRDRIQASLDQVRTNAIPTDAIPDQIIAEFGSLMRENIANGDIPFRKAWLKSIIDEVIVDDKQVRIIGSKHALERAMTGGKKIYQSVRGFERKWRTRRDSNS